MEQQNPDSIATGLYCSTNAPVLLLLKLAFQATLQNIDAMGGGGGTGRTVKMFSELRREEAKQTVVIMMWFEDPILCNLPGLEMLYQQGCPAGGLQVARSL